MSFKYLNDSGLAYFWTKIKAYVASLLGSKADDANVVHKTGNEFITGLKVFHTNEPDFIGRNKVSRLVIKNDNVLKGTPPEHSIWSQLLFTDNSDNSYEATGNNITNRLGILQCYVSPTTSGIQITAYKQSADVEEQTDEAALIVGYDTDGIKNARAPETSALRNNAQDILTRSWIPLDNRIVHTTGNETIAGSKTFTSAAYLSRETGEYHTSYVLHDSYSSNVYITHKFYDKNHNSLGDILYYLNSPANYGNACLEFRLFGNPNNPDWDFKGNYAGLGINIPASGSPFATAPHPVLDANGNQIATTRWVRTATGNTSLNAATATKLATARDIAVSGAVTGSASFDGSGNSTVATVWRSCMVGQSENSHTNPWYKVATWTASSTNQDSTIAFFVEGTYAGHASGILKIHIRIDNKKVNLDATEIFWVAGTEGIVNELSKYVLVCPTGDLPTVELWADIDENYKHRRFTVLSEGGRTSTGPQWVLLNASTAGQAASITTAGTQKVSVFLGQAQKVHSTVPISLGGTGATTRTGAVNNLFSEGMTTSNAKSFLVVNDNFANAGWLSLANVKSLLGLSNYLPLTGGSLTGTLTSTSDIVINGCFFRKNISVVKGTDPSGSCYWFYYFCDKNGTAYANNALGLLEGRLDSNGRMHVYLRAMKNTASSTSLAELGVVYDKAADTGYAYTTIAPPASSNDNKLPTTAWVRTYASGTYVDLTTVQDITNVKRFTNNLSLKSTDIVNTSMPSSNVYKNIYWVDKNNNSIGRFLFYQNSSANGGGKALVLDLSNVSSTPTLHTLLNAGFSNPSTSTDAFIVFGGTVKAVRPSAAGTTLGANSTTQRWGQIYSSSTTISTSDERMKDEITAVPDEVLDCWELVPWMQFKMKDSIAEKGDKARLHNGIIAQTVAKTFEDFGLDASRYGLFCYDEWDEDKNRYDDEGNLIYEGTEAGNLYSIRYEEALCMEAACQRRENARLKKRIADLEERLAALELKVS